MTDVISGMRSDRQVAQQEIKLMDDALAELKEES
jgi:hypothetical protein